MNPLVLVVDDKPDVEMLFRQQFRHDLRSDRFKMEFAQSGDRAVCTENLNPDIMVMESAE